jgi:hypothetical protein
MEDSRVSCQLAALTSCRLANQQAAVRAHKDAEVAKQKDRQWNILATDICSISFAENSMNFDEACAAMRRGYKARPTWFANEDDLWFVVHRNFLETSWLAADHEWRQECEFFYVRLDRFDYASGYRASKEVGPLCLNRKDGEDAVWELYKFPKVNDDQS